MSSQKGRRHLRGAEEANQKAIEALQTESEMN